ncbi:MAG: aminopeptidase N [Myxococcota bacterium]
MSTEKPREVFRVDYRPPDYTIDRVDLHFELGEDKTLVRARLAVRRSETLVGDAPPLVLDGEDLVLREIAVDGEALAGSAYHVDDESLTVHAPPARFELSTLVEIEPQKNTELSGLYKTSGNFCTQCEAHGFRRITYFLDRPDVMARYTTTIVADAGRYPVLLSNGNRVEDEALADGRRRVVWEDPFPKPCYLFALVAGDLRCHAGSFTTRSGREVALEIWVEPENLGRCEHALRALQRSMKWDEDVFGLEYDLDVYMIVAVNDFNMGAMENKGLNVFNSKYVLAAPETATDDEYEDIEAVIAHEYFHNWTGNRVTCRDWFQLTLKEGLTVYRDQRFSADVTSAAVKRIQDVKVLRAGQMPEDAGPMAHPIRPDSYISMDNFYTATVYNKGAEVVRLYETLLGRDGFRRGMDLYFERHDGQAVTCDDFRSAMADANEADLSGMEAWYAQAGTPELAAEGEWDAASKTWALTLRQSYPGAGEGDPRGPVPVPVRLGLLSPQGEPLPLTLAGEDAPGADERVLVLEEEEQRYVFTGVDAEPVPSLLRGFSAPVKLRARRSRRDLAFLMGRDGDAFNRWDAGQELASDLLLEMAAALGRGEKPSLDPLFVEAFGRLLGDPDLDGSLKALALTLPDERVLAQEMDPVDVDAIHAARERAVAELARAHRDAFAATFEATAPDGPYRIDKASIDRRRLRATALRYGVAGGDERYRAAAFAQFESADNMTDRQAALRILVDLDGAERTRALDAFYAAWRHDPLVLDKWFALQAVSSREDTLARVQELYRHEDFSLTNPNRVRALVGSFAGGNPVRFHAADGAGYRFLADVTLALDPINPQVASRMVSLFSQWRRYDAGRRERMRAELERIADAPKLSKDVYEMVGRALGRTDAAGRP